MVALFSFAPALFFFTFFGVSPPTFTYACIAPLRRSMQALARSALLPSSPPLNNYCVASAGGRGTRVRQNRELSGLATLQQQQIVCANDLCVRGKGKNERFTCGSGTLYLRGVYAFACLAMHHGMVRKETQVTSPLVQQQQECLESNRESGCRLHRLN